MAEVHSPPFYRRQFGAKLQGLREQAGLTLDDVASRLDKSRSALHRIENGETKADVHLVRSMMDVYDTFDPRLLDEARECAKPPWYSEYGLKSAWHIDVETKAIQVNDFSVQVVPALLQTEQYASALHAHRERSERDNEVAILRIRQQRIMDEEQPLRLITVIDETALRRTVGGRKVMFCQLRHLVTVAGLPTVNLCVLPSSRRTSTVGAFTLLTLPDTTTPTLGHVVHVAGSVHIEDPTRLTNAQQTFDRLREEAMSPADSMALIEDLASNLRMCW